MQSYLVFQLYAPLVSWGDQAVGQERPSSNHPSRSALLGLLGAALGISRDDETQQQRLKNSCLFAIKQYNTGIVLRDFHTIQAPPTLAKIHHLHTRKDELAMDKLGTMVSYRTYYQDNLSVIAVLLGKKTSLSLQKIKTALLNPHYQLYLGRKYCPLSIPLKPCIFSAENIKHAFNQYKINNELQGLSHNKLIHYYWQKGMNSGFKKVTSTVLRYDEPISRKRWQFCSRDEYMYLEKRGETQCI